MKTRITRHCCVKGCPNQPAKGRKTCGKHGKRRAAHSSRAVGHVHLDRVLNTWRDYADDDMLGAASVSPLPTEQPYIADVVHRSDGSLSGLPTTSDGLKRFLTEWLQRPGCTLADIDRLTAPAIPAGDRAIAICTASARLALHDLRHQAVPA